MNYSSALLAGAFGLLAGASASADVLISQYYEGSSNNKWIELTNTGAGAVSLDGFVLTSWTNAGTEDWKTGIGSPTNSQNLNGLSIPPDGYLLIGHPSAVVPAYAVADITSSVTNFNGDDSVVLYDTAVAAVGDVSAIVDALAFTDAGNEGGNTSFYRLTNGVGYDLVGGSTVLDYPTVWGEKTNGEVDSALDTDGWYLQKFVSANDLTISLSPTSVAEDAGAGVVDVTVTRTGDTAALLDVTLSTSDSSETDIPVPNQQVPAGKSSETFTMAIDAIDDSLADGPQTVTITATAVGFNDGTAELTVTDDGDTAPIVINEILADPPSGADVNGDGVPSTGQDEFVELVNVSGADLDISFWEIHDGGGSRHVFPFDTILPDGCAVVVFGGGTVDFISGSALFMTASSGGLSLNNASDTVTVFNDLAAEVASVNYGSGFSDESLTRDPDLTGSITAHPDATGSGGAAFSAGTKVDGTDFCPVLGDLTITVDPATMSESGGTLTATVTRTGDLTDLLEVIVLVNDDTEAETDLVIPDIAEIPAGEASVAVIVNAIDDIAADGTQTVTITGTAPRYNLGSTTFEVEDDGDGAFDDLVINEFLYDPPAGVDVNGDGSANTSEDEFIEILNISGGPFDLSNLEIHDAAALRHVFPGGTVLADGQAIVIFGGGSPSGTFGGSIIQTASGGFLGLNNGGDTIFLKDPGGVSTLLEVSYDGSLDDEALTRDPDETGTFVAHSAATGAGGALFSPGTMIDGSAFPGGVVVDAAVLTDLSVDLTTAKVTITFTGTPGYPYLLTGSATLDDNFPLLVAPTGGSTAPDGSGNGTVEFDFAPGAFFFRLEN